MQVLRVGKTKVYAPHACNKGDNLWTQNVETE